ncbi:hypothetical protein ABZL51_001640 [Campylobacter jejuni]|uniref:Uncharacterized protein n=1 Tax=Campylobacter jejuni TaxID=197 RepID=A0AAN3QYT4_CAMJU|nr:MULTISPECIES: hypothetical protein [Campylobacter]EAI2463112.1 hypothetical protein [Campylobacter jejuni]EAK3496241.1 hypothetical protein [Campylobacter jejuni]ECL6143843.1 hypothetical protein [Campylobacter jejuni]ECO2639787.1 hypothetical protein [Campylobacter jejuni]EDP3691287.1 hypothetical protein [Campylobacter jejuni]
MIFKYFIIINFACIALLANATDSINKMTSYINELDTINTKQNFTNKKIIALDVNSLLELKKHNFLLLQNNNLLFNYYEIYFKLI